MKWLLVILPVLVMSSLYAQQDIKLPQTGKTISDFISQGYYASEYEADLNGDNVQDAVVVLFNDLERNRDVNVDTVEVDFDTVKRPVLVLLKRDTIYVLAVKAMNLLKCKVCGGGFGDPFAGIEITNGMIDIGHYGYGLYPWRWSHGRKYKYRNGDFYLIHRTDHTFSGVDECAKLEEFPGTYENIDLISGERERKKISRDCKVLLDKTDKIKTKPLRMADDNINDRNE